MLVETIIIEERRSHTFMHVRITHVGIRGEHSHSNNVYTEQLLPEFTFSIQTLPLTFLKHWGVHCSQAVQI